MTALDDALATIGVNLPEDVRQAHIRDRVIALANSAQALILDLGTGALTTEQQVDTELQVVKIADEITRLNSLADLPPSEQPQAQTITDQVAVLTARVDAFAELAVTLAVAAGADVKEVQAIVTEAQVATADRVAPVEVLADVPAEAQMTR